MFKIISLFERNLNSMFDYGLHSMEHSKMLLLFESIFGSNENFDDFRPRENVCSMANFVSLNKIDLFYL